MPIRSIPPRTPMRDKYPVNGSAVSQSNKNYTYKKPTKTKPKRTSLEVHQRNDSTLDVFKEANGEIKIVGEFPNVEEDLRVYIEDNTINIISEKGEQAQLPDYFDIRLKSKKVRNGIMTLVFEKTDYEDIPELNEIFNGCLKKFPELISKNIALRVVRSRRKARPDSLDGAKVKINGKDGVLLFIPDALWGHWEVFKPIIYHELSHYIDLENPDTVFYKRADKKSIALWKKLQEVDAAVCTVDKK